ncbi:aminoglycoside phosphotransferase family protein [Paenibacillus sp. RC67]|uniref:aminoglycoside phosphotransferase family protein n=1 Tax=Paenibacillus sp. RC67 TaxID=3039392 RepID=UPI0024ADAD7B|nr:aminoglycoside phosphotransferase family protein [Paenibacillus sp. RC67]
MTTNLSYRIDFSKLCAKFNLGQLSAEPEPIFGGFLHKMYRMQTDQGLYAVKALNPQIMKRKTAMGNFIFSEKVARLAYQNGINALPAIVSNGSCIHEVDSQYYLLFPWVLGRIIPTGTVEMNCCKIMGEILAQIHRTDFSQLLLDQQDKEGNATKAAVNWKDYAFRGEQEGLEWAYLLSDNLDKIYHWEKLVSSSGNLLTKHKVISHRDLDQKNVLWDENHMPILIDWEAAGTINPTQELMDVAFYWSGFESGNVSKEAFCTLISTYRNHGGEICDNWLDVLNDGFRGKIEWLIYNIRRSLGLECTDETEQELGASEVFKTIQALNDYADVIPQCLEWLLEMDVPFSDK